MNQTPEKSGVAEGVEAGVEESVEEWGRALAGFAAGAVCARSGGGNNSAPTTRIKITRIQRMESFRNEVLASGNRRPHGLFKSLTIVLLPIGQGDTHQAHDFRFVFRRSA